MRLAFLALLLAIYAQAQTRSHARMGLIVASVVALQVATAVDVVSTSQVVGTRLPNGRVIGESNGLLGTSNHGFGKAGIALSFGITGAATVAEVVVLRRKREHTKIYDTETVLANAAGSAVHLLVARRNWNLR